MGRWCVKSDEERAGWALAPLVGVGPLRFGMSSDEVSLGVVSSFKTDAGKVFRDVGVTTYYSGSAGLAGVAVDARVGPQVTLTAPRWSGACRPSSSSGSSTRATPGRLS